MKRYLFAGLVTLSLTVLVLVSVTGCSSPDTSTISPGSGGGGMMGGSGSGSGNSTSGGSGSGSTTGGTMMGGGSSNTSNFASAGERIYLIGVGVDGQNISRTAPPVSQGSLMMGGGGCGSCHAANGRGGTITMMGDVTIKAPDITYDALVKEGFTDATIQQAIRDGLDESGKALDEAMPRWQMSDADLKATISYLKELAAR